MNRTMSCEGLQFSISCLDCPDLDEKVKKNPGSEFMTNLVFLVSRTRFFPDIQISLRDRKRFEKQIFKHYKSLGE